MTINRKSGLLLGIVFGIGCFYLSNKATVDIDNEINKEVAIRPHKPTIESDNNPKTSNYSGKFISLVDMSPAVLGAQAPIATPSPEIKPIDNNNL